MMEGSASVLPRTAKELAKLIDSTNLSLSATAQDIQRLCEDAKVFNFYGVCVNPTRTKYAKGLLENTEIKVVTVVGFPFGYSKPEVKLLEARLAIEDGTSEIDIVANIGWLKDGRSSSVKEEIASVAKLTKSEGRLLKVIIEAGVLNADQVASASRLVAEAGADFVKMGSGYGPTQVTVKDIEIIKDAIGSRLGIKAAGGIHNARDVLDFIRAGATRIGSSHGVEIIRTFIVN